MILVSVLVGCSAQPSEDQAGADRPNILFIAVDDLNDWIGPLGGHPQAVTPALDRLASQSVVFERNYCASPACNPSRTALLTGLHTYSSGLYSNYQYWREALPDAVTLPRYFRDQGYWVGGAGKIFHNDQPDPESWEEYFPSKDKHMPDYFYPTQYGTVSMPPFDFMYGDFDWSPIDLPDEETGDFSSVNSDRRTRLRSLMLGGSGRRTSCDPTAQLSGRRSVPTTWRRSCRPSMNASGRGGQPGT